MSQSEIERRQGDRGVTRWEAGPEPGFQYGARDPFERLFRLAGLLHDRFDSDLQRLAAGSPAIDVEEDDEAYEVSVELPGIRRDDLEVQLHQNVVTIRGEKRRGSDDEEGRRRRSRWSERTYGSVTRAFTLPPDADADRVEASFADGVLTLRLPKTEASKPRTIDVKASR